MPKLLYQGHGSFRLTSSDGIVVFIDPFIGTGYDLPADLVLVSHQHDDHNQLNLITQNPGCVVITEVDALDDGKHNTFSVKGIGIEAVEAGYNTGHSPDDSVGYILAIDGLTLYFSGDTSKTPQMAEFAARKIDYAFLCADGFYNMNLDEAAECAELIGARHNVPVHLKPGELFDRGMAEQFKGPNRLIIEAGDEVGLD
jgi:L-ascorbate metabolism protein UlaG (beta-lactamase superfamily)